jgi:parvulin-like peptidyl-prolyl isomerase
MLILQQGKERGYRMSDDQFKGILERIRKENRLDSEEAFQNALKQEGLTLAELRTQMERQMIVSRVQGDAVGKVGVSEEEERAYYDQHAGEFTTPASLTLREVLVAVPESTVPGPAGVAQPAVNVAADEEAQQKAEAIRARAVAGEDFAQIAAAESDAASKANGGLIGPLNQSELAPALKDLLAKMKPGDITGTLRTPKGYQILKLEGVTPAKVLTAEEAHDQIADRLFEQKRIVEIKKYLVKLRAQAIIEWKNEELRKAYESAVPSEQPPAEKPAGAPPPTS